MAQQTQPNVGKKKQVAQPVVRTTQPVEGQIQQGVIQETPIWKKWWLWLIIALVVIGVGVGIYFLVK